METSSENVFLGNDKKGNIEENLKKMKKIIYEKFKKLVKEKQ